MANTTTVNKQNKLLLGTLVVILAASAVLVAVTGSANKKKTPDAPPLEVTEEDGEKTEKTVKEGEKTPGTTSGTTDKTKENSEATGEGVKNGDKPAQNDPDKPAKEDKPSEKTNTVAEESAPAAAVNDIIPEFITPVDSLVIKGASLEVPVFSYTMNDYRTHSGLDFAASPGTPVCAAADGVISEICDDPMMGVTVAVSHTGGAVTKYKGLGEDSLSMKKVGESVAKGDVIGVSGDTALIESAEEDHVHFELSVNGVMKDPAEYVSVVFLSDVTED